MVSFDTVNESMGGTVGGESRLAEHLESLAGAWGLKARRCPVGGRSNAFNLVVSAEVSPDAEWLLLESHLDTVSVDGMTVPPFGLTVSEGRLHGRGACDTKASGAAMLWALKEYAAGTNHPRNAAAVFTVDEEAFMTGAQAFAQSIGDYRRLRGVIVGEPTQLRPVVAHNGAFRWRSITRGKAAHSADPSKGLSAIRAMTAVISALEEKMIPLANREFPLTGRAAASINTIRGGSAANVIPDYCEIGCDRRLVPGETIEQVLAERDAALEGLEVEHDSEYLAPPLPPENSDALHAWMQPAFAAAGLDASAAGAPYATNASHYASAGASVLVLGPGNIAQAHTKDEWISRDQLARAVGLFGAILRLP